MRSHYHLFAAAFTTLIVLPVSARPPENDTTNLRKLVTAADIIENYGNGAALTKEQFAKYLGEKSYLPLDKDANNHLSFDEFLSALLHCSADEDPGQMQCQVHDGIAKHRYVALVQGSTLLNAPEFYMRIKQNPELAPWWLEKVERQVDVHWELACGGGTAANSCTSVSENELNVYLKTLKARRATIGTKTWREEILGIGRDDALQVAAEDFDRMTIFERFNRLDQDANKVLDYGEFRATYNYDDAREEFSALSGDDLFVTSEEFLAHDVDLIIAELLAAEASLLWADVGSGAVRSDADTIKKNLKLIQKATDEEAKKKQPEGSVFGYQWIKNYGVVLYGNTVFDPMDEAVRPKWNEDFVTLRFIKDYMDSGSDADSASITYTKAEGGKGAYGIDAALRFDWYNPELYSFAELSIRPHIGVEAKRAGRGDEREHKYRVYMGADAFVFHNLGLWSGTHLRVSPSYQDDEKTDIEKVIGTIEIEPVLRFGDAFVTGSYRQLNDHVSFMFRPIFALEPAFIVSEPNSMDTNDGAYFRYGMKAGLRLLDTIKLTYTAKQREDIGGFDEGRFYQEGQLELLLDRNEQYSLTVGIKDGEDTPEFSNTEVYDVGIGIKF